MTNPPVYAIILAGGKGSRFWPRSRQAMPKQLCNIGNDHRTMLEMTIDRLEGLVITDQQFVVTQQAQATAIERLLETKKFAGKVIVEPQAKGTLAALTLAVMAVHASDPQALIISCHADAMIAKRDKLLSSLRQAIQVATHNDLLVTIGIPPTYPELGYDYLVKGETIDKGIYRSVLHYRPDSQTVERFLANKSALWNSGIFVWQTKVFLSELSTKQRQLFKAIKHCFEGGTLDNQLLADSYCHLGELSIEQGLLTENNKLAVTVADCGWNDVGSWRTLNEVLATDRQGNWQRGDTMLVDCQNTTVESYAPFVATIGLQDMVVIATGDAVLVCPRERAQEVRQVVAQLEKDKRYELL